MKNDSAVANDKMSSTHPSKSQLWFLESIGDACAHVIRNLEDDNKVLDLSASGTTDGTPVIAYNYHGEEINNGKSLTLTQTTLTTIGKSL